jgi:hypothetical protein
MFRHIYIFRDIIWKAVKVHIKIKLRLEAYACGELTNDAFYLIGSAVSQCMKYHWTTKVRQKTFYFSFLRVLAGLIRLTRMPSYLSYGI